MADYLGTPGSGTASLGTAGLINVQGTLTLPSSGLNLSLLNNSGAGGLGSASNGFYELFTYGSLSGTPSSAFPASNGAKLFTYYNPAGQIDVQVSILALSWAGTASSSWDTAGSTNWANGSTAASYLEGADVTFSDTNSLTGGTVSNSNVVIQATGVQPNSVTFNNNAVNYTLSNASGTAGIAGTAGIVKSGSGTVNLQSPNSFQGQVLVNSGILNITNGAALGSSAGVSVAAGGALQLQGNIGVGAIALSLSGNGFAGSPAGALNSVSGTNSYAGAVTLGGPSTIAANAGQLTLTGGINTAGNLLTISGVGNTTISTLGVSGSGGLTAAGPGTTTLSAASSYSGTTSVTGGVLAIPGGFSGSSTGVNVTGGSMIVQTAFNASSGTTTINLNGGVLQTPAWTSGPNTIVNFNGGTLQANASSSNFLGGSLGAVRPVNINAGGATIDTQANNIAIIQPLVGAGGLTKKGPGTLTLSASNSYGGSTVVSAGVLQLGGLNSLLPAPVARYPFEGNTNDASGNGNNATLQNGPATYTAGQFGQAITLNGGNQYLTVPFSAGLSLSGSYTVSTWVNINSQPAVSANGGPALFSTRNGGDGTFDLQYYQPSTGVYALHADIGGTGGFINTAVNYTLPGALTGWNLVTLEVNSSGATYFVNGGSVSTTAFSGTPLFMKGGQTLSLGSQEAGGGSYGAGGYLNGSLDEANIFSGNLTPAQVLTLYQGQEGQLPVTPLVVNSGATFDLNGVSQQVASLSGGGAVTSSVAGNATLTVTSTATGISTYSGTIGNGAGALSLLLTGTQGSGEFLTGVNTFTGSVSVAANAGHFSSLILANSGALLGPTLTSGNGVVFDQSVASTPSRSAVSVAARPS